MLDFMSLDPSIRYTQVARAAQRAQPDATAVQAAWSSSVAMGALRQYERGGSSPRETARVDARANTRI